MTALAPNPARLIVDRLRDRYGHNQLADDPALVGHTSQPWRIAPSNKVIEIVDCDAFAARDELPLDSVCYDSGRVRNYAHFRHLPRYRKRATHGWGSAYHAKIAGEVQRRDSDVTRLSFPQARAA